MTPQELKREADALLKEHQIVEALSRFGDTTIHGSYDLDLMVWPELDIVVFAEGLQSSLCWDLLKALHERSPATVAMVINHCDYRLDTVMPGSVLIDYRIWRQDIEWKLDIALAPMPKTSTAGLTKVSDWIVHHGDPRAYNAMVRSRMDANSHKLIYRIKTAFIHSNYYRRMRWVFTPPERYFGTHDIYSAVFDHGVSSPQEFVRYLASSRGIDLASDPALSAQGFVIDA